MGTATRLTAVATRRPKPTAFGTGSGGDEEDESKGHDASYGLSLRTGCLGILVPPPRER